YELPCLIGRRVRRFFQFPEERSQEQDRAGAEAAERNPRAQDPLPRGVAVGEGGREGPGDPR
ncbi:MAG: hypothetical protein ACE5GW_06995, partial [Planctomycetota bacterium]